MNIPGRAKVLSFFNLVMINIIAIDSLRSLPIAAEYGWSLIFLYAIMAAAFFIPCALVVAELATGWPTTGGIYVWVREAFGKRSGFFIIFMQWIYNVVWFPTIMAFIASTCFYLIDPALPANNSLIFFTVLILFWVTTGINCLGMKASSVISTIGALVGTIIPMLFIASLGGYWLWQGHPIASAHTHLIPTFKSFNDFAFVGVILFGLVGLEMSAVHAGDVRNPKRDFPLALIISVVVILLTLILGSLAIAFIIPPEKLNIITGLIEAYDLFLIAFHLQWLTPVIIGLIVIGSLCGVSAWVLGPATGLYAAAHDGCLPHVLTKTNKKGAPYVMLLLQGAIFTVISLLFLLMPSVSSSYWILSNMTAQLALLVYIGLFGAAIRLHHKKSSVERGFKIPGGNFGMWLTCGLGITCCVFAILLGFLPPSQLAVGNIHQYEIILIGSFVLFCLMPVVIYRKKTS